MLAKRLIHTLSVSMDAEEGMISRLKVNTPGCARVKIFAASYNLTLFKPCTYCVSPSFGSEFFN